jgi:predicted phage terminase large subunit-like protein
VTAPAASQPTTVEYPIIGRLRARHSKNQIVRSKPLTSYGTQAPSITKVRDILEHPDELHAEMARRHLRWYVKYAWKIIEPKAVFKPNWHIDAICDHLQAVDDGEIRNLVINVPPRTAKSITVSVMWPTRSWIAAPETKWLFSSYAHTLAIRDAVKSRRLIQSNWYQQHFGESFKLAGDQNVKSRYDNDKMGYRVSTSVGGTATGEGGDIVVVDDPHNVFEAESDTIREGVILWWDEVMSTRLNDPETGSKIIIMQRSHQSDLAGHVLEQGGYVHLMLPMEFEPERKCFTEIGFEDPRTVAGELLCANRIGPKAVADLKRSMGSYATAGQLQQRPTSRGGSMIKVDQLNFIDEIDESNVKKRYRSWDKAGTDDGGAWTVGLRMGSYRKPRLHGPDCGHDDCRGSLYFIDHVERGQWSAGPRERRIVSISDRDGKKVRIVVEQEPGSSGKESAEATKARLKNRTVELERPTGDKEVRADPMAVAIENGEMDILIASWNDVLIDELRHFPQSTFKDQTDSGSQAFAKLKKGGKFHVG